MTSHVFFYSAGLRLAATCWEPADGDPLLPGVVLCQGFGSGRDVNLPAVGDRLRAAGFAVLSFDHRGLGESEGTRGRIVPAEQVEDVRNALTWLGAQPGVDPGRLSLFGFSFGGANAVVAAAVDPRARAVVAAVPFGDGERWLRSLRRHWEWEEFRAQLDADRLRRVVEGGGSAVDPGEILLRDPESAATAARLAEAFPSRVIRVPLETAERICEYRPEEWVAQIAPRPLLVVHAARDLLIPVDEARRLFERAAEPKRFVLVADASHYGIYSGPPFEALMAEAIPFLRRGLSPQGDVG